MRMTVGIILGTGAESTVARLGGTGETIVTPYGDAMIYRASTGSADVVLVPRHGLDHSRLPHRLNYRSIIWALRAAGAHQVFATNACGSLRRDLAPGALAAPHDLIDLTRTLVTFWDDERVGDVAHAHNDFTKPYCAAMRASLIDAAQAVGATLHPAGVYLCVDGPRFETAAEVRLFASWGADLIGMTGAPEAVLAREAGLCYAPVAIVGNLGAGLGGDSISHTAVADACQAATVRAVDIILEAISRIDRRACSCPPVVPPVPPATTG